GGCLLTRTRKERRKCSANSAFLRIWSLKRWTCTTSAGSWIRMIKRDVNINVEYLTRVEGHGNIVVNMKEGRMEACRLDIVEAPRFFEGILRGRSVFEAQHITSRICGICSCGHTLASIQAA